MVPVLVLATCVVVAALRSSTGASFALIDLLDTGRFVAGITGSLVLDYEAVAMRSLDATGMTAEDVSELIDYVCRVGQKAVVRFRVRPSLPDPNDELVVEAAVAAGAAWIVTHNVRDLAPAARFGIEVITPGEALRRLGVER